MSANEGLNFGGQDEQPKAENLAIDSSIIRMAANDYFERYPTFFQNQTDDPASPAFGQCLRFFLTIKENCHLLFQ